MERLKGVFSGKTSRMRSLRSAEGFFQLSSSAPPEKTLLINNPNRNGDDNSSNTTSPSLTATPSEEEDDPFEVTFECPGRPVIKLVCHEHLRIAGIIQRLIKIQDRISHPNDCIKIVDMEENFERTLEDFEEFGEIHPADNQKFIFVRDDLKYQLFDNPQGTFPRHLVQVPPLARKKNHDTTNDIKYYLESLGDSSRSFIPPLKVAQTLEWCSPGQARRRDHFCLRGNVILLSVPKQDEGASCPGEGASCPGEGASCPGDDLEQLMADMDVGHDDPFSLDHNSTVFTFLSDVNIWSYPQRRSSIDGGAICRIRTEWKICLRQEDEDSSESDKTLYFEDFDSFACWYSALRLGKYADRLFRAHITAESLRTTNHINPKKDVPDFAVMDFTRGDGQLVADSDTTKAVGLQGGGHEHLKRSFRHKSLLHELKKEIYIPQDSMILHLGEVWFHDFEDAEAKDAVLKKMKKMVDGVFLVRPSKSKLGCFVVNLTYRKELFTFLVSQVVLRNRLCFTMDFVTFFFDLVQLVDFYSINPVHLPTVLVHPFAEVERQSIKRVGGSLGNIFHGLSPTKPP